jgi:hypothetical protein
MYYPGGASALIALGGLILIAATLRWVLRSTGALPIAAAAYSPSRSSASEAESGRQAVAERSGPPAHDDELARSVT